MITGTHTVIYSQNAEADRAFFRDVLDFPYVDAGGGWLIFRLPPSEVAFHPAEEDRAAEFYLVCADIVALTARLTKESIPFTPVKDEGWGLLTIVTLPGGSKLGIYEARHHQPE